MREQSEMVRARFDIKQDPIKMDIHAKPENLTEEEISQIGKDFIPETVGDKE